jgi:hypothetical protein
MKPYQFFWGLLIATTFGFGEGARYLIITHDNFYNAIKPLAQWKQRKGISTKIVKLSEIGASPSSISVIKNYIVNAYNTWTPRPEYVLLVGAGSYINAENSNYDDYYANMEGDHKMELAIGRFPVTTVAQCSLLVAKTLNYERNPYLVDTTWYYKGTTIVRDGYDEDDTVYWNDARYVHSLWRNAQFRTIDSLSSARGANSTSVMNAINNGRSYLLYRGTATVNWYQPFQNVNPSNLTNGYKLPVIVSATCATMSLFYDDYLGNRFMNAGTATNPKGAVAFIGTTISATGTGLARQRGAVAQQFFKAVFVDRIYRLGEALKRAKYVLDSLQLPGYTTTRYREWNLFGDPELNLWTQKPKPLTVVHDTNVLTVPQNYQIIVTSSGLPVPNALVCIMMDTLIYQYGYTNSDGRISFFINPPQPDSMHITVTASNYIPYLKTIYVRYGQLMHDVGVTSIVEPQGVIHTAMTVIPKVKIRNYGPSADTVSVMMKIGNVYEAVVHNIVLGGNDTLTVTFPTWQPVPGNHQVLAYTILNSDQYRGNDSLTGSVLVNIARDVGVEFIVAPESTQYTSTIINPTIIVKNYGVLTQTNFWTSCSIIHQSGSLLYHNQKPILTLAAGETTRVVFDGWQPQTTGLCTIKFRTNLLGDENPNNDQRIRLCGLLAGVSEDKFKNPASRFNLTVLPNPVGNYQVAFEFTLDQRSVVRLTIYDATGQKIRELLNQELEPGKYSVSWDIKDKKNHRLSPGIYFSSLTNLTEERHQKIILTR